jgi:hypothetical protein
MSSLFPELRIVEKYVPRSLSHRCVLEALKSDSRDTFSSPPLLRRPTFLLPGAAAGFHRTFISLLERGVRGPAVVVTSRSQGGDRDAEPGASPPRGRRMTPARQVTFTAPATGLYSMRAIAPE